MHYNFYIFLAVLTFNDNHNNQVCIYHFRQI